MKTESISVPHFEGYKCIGLLKPHKGHYVISMSGERLIQLDIDLQTPMVVYEKISPKRYIFEETGEFREVLDGELYLSIGETIDRWDSKKPSLFEHKILRKVDDGQN